MNIKMYVFELSYPEEEQSPEQNYSFDASSRRVAEVGARGESYRDAYTQSCMALERALGRQPHENAGIRAEEYRIETEEGETGIHYLGKVAMYDELLRYQGAADAEQDSIAA